MESPTPLISLANVSVRFSEQEQNTLARIQLKVLPEEVLGIVGPSGCGKSTLLRVLADLQPVQSGTRMVPQTELDKPGQVAMVFQDARLLPWRTVWDNMQLPFELTGTAINRERIDELLSMTGLAKADRDKYPRMLSGGMKMRVALARALVLHPQLVLLDEPFAAVDDLLREELNLELLRLKEQLGFGVVLVTHHIGEAVFLSDRIAVMTANPGQIQQTLQLSWQTKRDEALRSTPEYVNCCRDVKLLLVNK